MALSGQLEDADAGDREDGVPEDDGHGAAVLVLGHRQQRQGIPSLRGGIQGGRPVVAVHGNQLLAVPRHPGGRELGVR
jgi:hypothetical protein